jgi:5-oxoprolinase (ATP-hydrolysing)
LKICQRYVDKATFFLILGWSVIQSSGEAKWQFQIDRGGTFTDIVANSPDGAMQTRKLFSEKPEAYRDAAVHGFRQFLAVPDAEPMPVGQISCVGMGTMVATNALLEREGEKTLLFITKGFGDRERPVSPA